MRYTSVNPARYAKSQHSLLFVALRRSSQSIPRHRALRVEPQHSQRIRKACAAKTDVPKIPVICIVHGSETTRFLAGGELAGVPAPRFAKLVRASQLPERSSFFAAGVLVGPELRQALVNPVSLQRQVVTGRA